jgi:5-amino-6-(5-phospho-D-ribitylamino)uracil phosphatase
MDSRIILLRNRPLALPSHIVVRAGLRARSTNRHATPRGTLRIHAFAAPTSAPSPIREEGLLAHEFHDGALKPLPRKLEGAVDDPSLANPLQRMERLGTGWLGVIMELEGVCVDYEYGDVASRAWTSLAQEEDRAVPPIWALKRSEGMKNDQAIQEVFCWTRNPTEVRRLAGRKEEILEEMLADRRPMVSSGALRLLDAVERGGAPVALVSSAPERRVHSVLDAAALTPRFEAVVTGDDVARGRPDPEGYLYAAQRIGRPPLRCVVVGTSNLSVEAAHEVGMRCVAVAGRHPLYELAAADLVVRSLGDLSFVNLKQLFAEEDAVMPRGDGEDEELEEELYEDDALPSLRAPPAIMDR